jgi:hypothetical protein
MEDPIPHWLLNTMRPKSLLPKDHCSTTRLAAEITPTQRNLSLNHNHTPTRSLQTCILVPPRQPGRHTICQHTPSHSTAHISHHLVTTLSSNLLPGSCCAQHLKLCSLLRLHLYLLLLLLPAGHQLRLQQICGNCSYCTAPAAACTQLRPKTLDGPARWHTQQQSLQQQRQQQEQQ